MIKSKNSNIQILFSLIKKIIVVLYSLCELWRIRLAVRTPASHAGNRGSIPLCATKIAFKSLNLKGYYY